MTVQTPSVPSSRVKGRSCLYVMDKYEQPIGPKLLMYSEIVVRDLRDPLRDIAHQRGFTLDRVLSDERSKELVACRAVMIHYLRSRNMSYPQIGRRLRRDHSSIIHLARTRDANGEKIRG